MIILTDSEYINQHNICSSIYKNDGRLAFIKYANEQGFSYGYCFVCDEVLPILASNKECGCALCLCPIQ